jgi:hypothetical protein
VIVMIGEILCEIGWTCFGQELEPGHRWLALNPVARWCGQRWREDSMLDRIGVAFVNAGTRVLSF